MPSGGNLNRYSIFDFSGGLDVKSSALKLAMVKNNSRLLVAENIVYNIDGSVTKRPGMVSRSSYFATAHETILGGTRYTLSSGTEWDVIATSEGKVYKVDPTTAVRTSIKTGLTNTTHRTTYAVYSDVLFIANGVDAPQQWDGTTFSALGGSSPSKARVIVSHANRLFASDNNATTKSRLSWSKLNNATDWSGTDDAGFIEIYPNDNAQLLALVPSIQELSMFKTFRPFRLQGIGPISGYTVADSLVPSSGSIGALSIVGADFVGNDVWYVSVAGVHSLAATSQFGDLTTAFKSTLVEPYFRPTRNPFGANGNPYSPNVDTWLLGYSDFVDSPQVLHDPYANRILVGQDSRGLSGMDRLMVYDLSTKAWSAWSFINPSLGARVTSLWTSVGPPGIQAGEIKFGFGSSATPFKNLMAAFDRESFSDIDVVTGSSESATLGIPATVSHVSALGAPGWEKCPRYLFLYFNEETDNTQIDVSVTYDFADTAQVQTTVDLHSGANYAVNGSFENWSGLPGDPPDDWVLGSGLTVVKEAVIVKVGSFSAKLTGTSGGFLGYFVATSPTIPADNSPPFSRWAGRTITFGCWMHVASTDAFISINDSVSTSQTNAKGTGDWEWLTVTQLISESGFQFTLGIFAGAGVVAYADGAVLIWGDYIDPEYGTITPRSESQIVKRIDLGQAWNSEHLCEFMTVSITNDVPDQTFTWLGYEVDYRLRRKIRRAE